MLPLELEFDSRIPKRFVVDGATYDRGGRLTIDELQVEPNDAVTDPLLDYFALGGGSLGGLRSMGVLGEKPFTVKLNLNEWLRFDKPGRYTLQVRSQRVNDELTATSATRSFVPVQSNVLSFEILPRDPEWEATQFVSAMEILKSSARDVDRRQGCRMLRYLGTDAAVDALIAHFDDEVWGCSFDATGGVVGALDRGRALRQMEAGLQASDQPISEYYLHTLSRLHVFVKHPEFRTLQTRENKGRFPESVDREHLQQLAESANATYRAILDQALSQKTERARAFILSWQLGSDRRGAQSSSEQTSMSASMRDQLATVFRQLSTDRQAALLEYEWQRVAGPAMLPALRPIIDDPDLAVTPVRDLALRRLYELAPDEGRARILRDIVNPPRDATLTTLGALPDRELPQLDDVLAANIDFERNGGSLDVRTELLQRYASSAVVDRLLPRVDPLIGRLACRPQAALLAYFIRANADIGKSFLDRALASRGETGCFQFVIADVAKLHMTADLEAAAIDHLDDPDPQVTISAAETLGRFGSQAASQPLRAQFERWHRRWADRAEELRFRHAQEHPDSMQGMVELAFLQALARAQAWVTGEADVRELQMLCVTDNCRQQAGYILDAARDRYIRVWRVDGHDNNDHIEVAQYQLTSLDAALKKLVQFPRATAFTLDVSTLEPDVATRVTSELVKAADAQGITISRH